MHIIIDGYNLIRQSQELQLLDAQDLEAGRNALVARLAAYRKRSGHKITIVFDGWLGGELVETRDHQHGMLIVYSRRGEKADEVIKRLLASERQRALVVSSDREIQVWARDVGAAWISANQFESQHLLAPGSDSGEGPVETRRRSKKGPAHRLPKGERRRRQRLKKL